MQRELLRRIVDGELKLFDFAYTFTYVSKFHDENNAAFVQRVLVPFYNDVVRLSRLALEAEEEAAEQATISKTRPAPYHFVHPQRISELKGIKSPSWDLSRLIQLCTEIDICYQQECYLAVATLTRAIIDHVPPIFGANSFSEVANNYGGGGKSFRDAMQHLANSARKIGDSHLHVQIRPKEVLPNATQVNFARELDVLLAEIVRLLS